MADYEVLSHLSLTNTSTKGYCNGTWYMDMHPTRPWALLTLGTNSLKIWDFRYKCVRMCVGGLKDAMYGVGNCCKFIARRDWAVVGCSSGWISVYNYITGKKVMLWPAHELDVTSLAVHPSLPYLLSSGGGLIKLWEWDRGWCWKCTRTFEADSTCVYHITFNPKHPNTFASAGYDTTIKVWNLDSSDPDFTMAGHSSYVRWLNYYTGDENPYLISASDDGTAKVWDYETKTCIHTLTHGTSVTSASFHPQLPIIVTGSYDGKVRYWDSITYRLDNVQDYGSCIGCIGVLFARVAIVYDSRFVVVKLGCDRPVASMDPHTGRILLAKHDKILTSYIKTDELHYKVTDGERLPIGIEELCPFDIYPQYMKHSPDGSCVTIGGDGEYVILKTLEKHVEGHAFEFVWSCDGEYAIQDSTSNIKIFAKDFQVRTSYAHHSSIERIFGGALLALCDSQYIRFLDWAHCELITLIQIARVQNIFWDCSGEMVAITTDTSLFIYKYLVQNGIGLNFEKVHEANEGVKSGLWVDYKCFIYVNSSWRLNYCVGDEVTTLFYLDRPMYLLGYIATVGCVYLFDMEFNVVGCTIPLQLINYKKLVMSGDIGKANAILPYLPIKHCDSAARFWESKGMLDVALGVATNPDYRFELAIQLDKLEIAKEIATSEADSNSKWKRLGECSMSTGKVRSCLPFSNF